jgi:hypothetical protein
MQTLINLDVQCNSITDEGAQHLANILQHNTVGLIVYSSILYATVPFNTDTHHTESCRQQNR